VLQAGAVRGKLGGLRFALSVAACAALFALPLAVQAASTVDYTYDPLGRVTKAVYNDGARTTTVTYNYDATGNRASVVSTNP